MIQQGVIQLIWYYIFFRLRPPFPYLSRDLDRNIVLHGYGIPRGVSKHLFLVVHSYFSRFILNDWMYLFKLFWLIKLIFITSSRVTLIYGCMITSFYKMKGTVAQNSNNKFWSMLDPNSYDKWSGQHAEWHVPAGEDVCTREVDADGKWSNASF